MIFELSDGFAVSLVLIQQVSPLLLANTLPLRVLFVCRFQVHYLGTLLFYHLCTVLWVTLAQIEVLNEDFTLFLLQVKCIAQLAHRVLVLDDLLSQIVVQQLIQCLSLLLLRLHQFVVFTLQITQIALKCFHLRLLGLVVILLALELAFEISDDLLVHEEVILFIDKYSLQLFVLVAEVVALNCHAVDISLPLELKLLDILFVACFEYSFLIFDDLPD